MHKILSRTGLFLFLAAFGLWIILLGLGTFQLQERALQNTLSPYQYEYVAPHVATFAERPFTHVHGFTQALGQALDRANADIKADLATRSIDPSNGEYWSSIIQPYLVTRVKYQVAKASASGVVVAHIGWWFALTVGLAILGALLYMSPRRRGPAGIQHNGIRHSSLHQRGWLGMMAGGFLILFYIVLYFAPQYMVNWIILMDPLSKALSGSEASQWFLYGFLYTIAVAVMGVRMLLKYRHNRYQQVRTISVMFFQTAFAFLIPQFLAAIHRPALDLKNIWPLDYSFFYRDNLSTLLQNGTVGYAMLVWGILLVVIGVPLFTFLYGKRWYCSWVCGCGGLAETLGDPFRQLSDKRLRAWEIERWLINGVLVFAVLMTGAFLYTYFTGSDQVLSFSSSNVKTTYGFLISSIFAGVVGTGFYPLMGNRVWCRFGCPLAAYFGWVQKWRSRFRITTNGGQCISCGNCSAYCEMGIDVRAYAQRGQDIVRASCVGCGVCAAVCPRGVLKLENADFDASERAHELKALHIDRNGVTLLH